MPAPCAVAGCFYCSLFVLQRMIHSSGVDPDQSPNVAMTSGSQRPKALPNTRARVFVLAMIRCEFD